MRGVGLSLIVGIDSKTEEIVATIKDDDGCSLGVGDVKSLLVLGKYKEKVVGSGCNVLNGRSMGTSDVVMLAVLLTDMNISELNTSKSMKSVDVSCEGVRMVESEGEGVS